MLRFAGFELDLDRVELRTADGTALKLRPKTFALLHLFATNANRLLSKHELMVLIWPNIHVGDDSLFQCIREIRSALGDSERRIVRSVSGRGYLFEAEVFSDKAAGTSPGQAPADPASPVLPVPAPSVGQRQSYTRRHPVLAASLVVGFAAALAFAAPILMQRLATPETLTITVVPVKPQTSDAATVSMAADFTDRLTDGLSEIGNIRVLSQ